MSKSSSEPPVDGARTGQLTESTRHRLLAADSRRAALRVLAERDRPIGLEELATALVAREDGVETGQTASVDRLAIILHHQHLPLMAAAGAIDYEPEARRVESVDVPADLL